MNEPITLLVAHSYPVVRFALFRLLSPVEGISVIAELSTAREIRFWMRQSCPRLVVLGLEFEDGNAIELCHEITHSRCKAGIVLLCHRDIDMILGLAWEVGVAAVISLELDTDRIVDIIKRVASGEHVWNSDQITRCQLWQRRVRRQLEQLTQREWEVLGMLLDNKNYDVISQTLAITRRTLEKHVYMIYKALGIHSRIELYGELNYYTRIARTFFSREVSELPEREGKREGKE